MSMRDRCPRTRWDRGRNHWSNAARRIGVLRKALPHAESGRLRFIFNPVSISTGIMSCCRAFWIAYCSPVSARRACGTDNSHKTDRRHAAGTERGRPPWSARQGPRRTPGRKSPAPPSARPTTRSSPRPASPARPRRGRVWMPLVPRAGVESRCQGQCGQPIGQRRRVAVERPQHTLQLRRAEGTVDRRIGQPAQRVAGEVDFVGDIFSGLPASPTLKPMLRNSGSPLGPRPPCHSRADPAACRRHHSRP